MNRDYFSMKLFAWMGALSVLVLWGFYSGYVVLTQGLIVTGMSNSVVWGLWIAADFSFISLSAGAFTVSALIYVFHLDKYKGIGRLAVFIGLIGYTITMLTLVLDVGRPDRFYYPLLYWNNSSVLLEIFWCISMYLAVLVGEFAPTVTEAGRLGRSRVMASLTRGLRWATPALAAAGAVFSTLHQSSLGALYGVLVARPLWNSALMPFLFLLSAIPAGLSMTVLAAMVVSRFAKREVASKVALNGIGKIAGVSLLIYIGLYDWNYFIASSSPTTSALLSALSGTPYQYLTLGLELGIGAVAPAIVFLVPRLRQSGKALFVAASLVVVGLVADRWDITVMGQLANDAPPVTYVRGGDLPVFGIHLASYIPTWPEWISVVGAVALGLLLFTVGVKYFKVLPPKETIGARTEA
jgi:Ni/Fe-hydrogenase subunit HybB-like protein